MIKCSYIPNNIYTASFSSGAPNVSWHQDKVGMWCNSQSNCEEACNLFCAPVTLRLNEFSCRTAFNDSSLDIWNTSRYLLLSKGKSLQHWEKKCELLSLKNLISVSNQFLSAKIELPLTLSLNFLCSHLVLFHTNTLHFRVESPARQILTLNMPPLQMACLSTTLCWLLLNIPL